MVLKHNSFHKMDQKNINFGNSYLDFSAEFCDLPENLRATRNEGSLTRSRFWNPGANHLRIRRGYRRIQGGFRVLVYWIKPGRSGRSICSSDRVPGPSSSAGRPVPICGWSTLMRTKPCSPSDGNYSRTAFILCFYRQLTINQSSKNYSIIHDYIIYFTIYL